MWFGLCIGRLDFKEHAVVFEVLHRASVDSSILQDGKNTHRRVLANIHRG